MNPRTDRLRARRFRRIASLHARTIARFVSAALGMLLVWSSSPAQEPAIVTIDPAALGAGRIELSAGVEHAVKDRPPAVPSGPGAAPSPARLRRLTRVLPISARYGAAGNVDVIATWRGGLFARGEGGDSFSDWGDPALFAKIVLTGGGSAIAAAVLFGIKIPSTSYLPSGLGSDAADVHLLGAASRTFDRGELRVNAGVAILGDPRAAGSQNDVFTGSLFGRWRPADRAALHAELHGFTGPREGDDKLELRGGITLGGPTAAVTIYVLGRVAGDGRDFSTAFHATADRGAGAAVRLVLGP